MSFSSFYTCKLFHPSNNLLSFKLLNLPSSDILYDHVCCMKFFWLIQCDVYSITHSQFDVQWSEIRSVKLKMFGILDTKIYNTTSVGTTICKIFSQIINQLLYTSESTLACRHSLFCLKTHTRNLSSSL